MINKHNPYFNRKLYEKYDSLFDVPVIRSIRSQESQALEKIFDGNFQKSDKVLEIGAGTGFYSLGIASRVKHLTALEPVVGMSDILKKRIDEQNVRNIKIVNVDFFEFPSDQKFDHVIAVGVLDYVKDWKRFIDKCLAISEKTVIFTAPQAGLLGNAYKLSSRFEGIVIFLYNKHQIDSYLKKHRIEIEDVGLKSIFTGGMTLIVNVKK